MRGSMNMNHYSRAALKVYGGLFLMFFLLPVLLLSFTQRFANGIVMLLWAFGVFLGASLFTTIYGIIHFHYGKASPAWALGQSIVTLLGAVVAAALPALWVWQSRDLLTLSGWIVVYGFVPVLFCALLYLGAIRSSLEK